MKDPAPSPPPESVASLATSLLGVRDVAQLLRRRRLAEPLDATRVAIDGRPLVNFSGNDYLGLSFDPRLVAALCETTRVGSGAASLVTGYTSSHRDAEQTLAAWKGVDNAALLPSGYQANVAAVQTFAAIAEGVGRPIRFLADKLVHASLIDAIRSTGADFRVFPHNGLAKLERLLSDDDQPSRLDVIVTESIFSMDGDQADLTGIAGIRRRGRQFSILLDEAHATGLYGRQGAGLSADLLGESDLGIATFSKTAGVVGGAVYGSNAMIEAVVNLGRAYIYTTAPPPPVAHAIVASINAMRDADDRRERLRANVIRVREGIARLGLASVPGDSPIVPVIVGSAERAMLASQRLVEAGFLVVAVRPPTVPPGTSRLRLTVNSEHSADQIDGLLGVLDACR